MSKIPTKRVPSSPSKVTYRTQQRKSVYTSFKTGDRVVTNEKVGTIAFIGPTKFAEGDWIGISLDEPLGKNDGSYDGARYFETDANHGLFCRPDKVQPLTINGSLPRNSHLSLSRQSVIETASNHGSEITPIDKEDVQIGDRVSIRGTKFGTVKYIGKIHLDDGVWCGIKLDGPSGKHDGKVDGVRYFRCPHRFGLFSPLRHVEKVHIDPRDARHSILSTGSSSHNRDSPDPDSNLSEFSFSSDSTGHFLPRSPKIVRQKSSTTDLTPMETSLSNQVAQLQEQIREKDSFIRKLEQQTEKDRLEDFLTREKIQEMEKHMVQLQRQYETTENENLNLIKEQFELKQRLDELQDESILPDDEEMQQKILELESTNQKLEEQLKDNASIKQIEALKLQIIDLENRGNEDEVADQHHAISNGGDEYYEKQIKAYEEQLNQTKMNIESSKRDYENELKQYQMKIDDDNHQIQKLQDTLKSLHDEKTSQDDEFHQTIAALKQTEQQLQADINELNERERKANRNLHQREIQFEQQIDEYDKKLEQANLRNQQLENEKMNTMARDLETLRTELQNRDRMDNEYKSKAEQSLLEIDHLRSKLRDLEDEKTTMENELNSTIDTLKQQNQRELQRQAEFEQQINDYRAKFEATNRTIEQLQSQSETSRHEKNQVDDTIDALAQELQALKTELQDREHAHNTTIHDLEGQQQSQMKDLRYQLTNLCEEKTMMEKRLHENIGTLKHDYEKFQTEQKQKEKSIQSHYEQEFDEYQKNLELSIHRMAEQEAEFAQLHEEKEASEKRLNEKIEAMKIDFEKRIQIVQIEKKELEKQNRAQEERLKEYESTMDETHELFQRVEDVTKLNERLKKELQDLKNEHDPAVMEELNKQVAVLQQMHLTLLEKQAVKEQEYLADKKAQEKIFQEKIGEHEMKIAMMKSEHMVELENVRLDFDQEILRLKALIPKPPPSKGKK